MDLQQFIELLREEFRLKQNCDFAYTLKYGELHVLCAEVFKGIIEQQAAIHNITITKFHTY